MVAATVANGDRAHLNLALLGPVAFPEQRDLVPYVTGAVVSRMTSWLHTPVIGRIADDYHVVDRAGKSLWSIRLANHLLVDDLPVMVTHCNHNYKLSPTVQQETCRKYAYSETCSCWVISSFVN